MKAGWTPDLDLMVKRPDPTARQLLEAAVVERSDVKQTKTQWGAADSLTGLITYSNGTVALPPGLAVLIENATHNSFATNLDGRAGSMRVARVDLNGTEPSDAEIYSIMAYLDPANGGAKEVDQWELHIYLQVTGILEPGPDALNALMEIADPIRVSAPGVAGDVTFDYSTAASGGRPTPKRYGASGVGATAVPVIYIEIRGLKTDGSPAANIGWGVDTTKASVGGGINDLRGFLLTDLPPGQGSWGSISEADQAATPRCRVRVVSGLSAATITFSGAGNRLNLGAAPSGTLELQAWGDTPSGSSITFQIQNPASPGWVTFKDGDTIQGLGLAVRQDYDVRATLTPGAGTAQSPSLRALGIREMASVFFLGVVREADITWSVDPIEGRGEISDAVFTVIRDGVPDGKEQIADLLVAYDPAKIELRYWIAPADPLALPRNTNPTRWCMIDSFMYEDHRIVDAGVQVTGFSAAYHLRRKLPVYNDGANTVSTLVYTNQSLKAVWDDLINGQSGMAARHRGPGVEDTTNLVTKTIEESDVKEELNAIGWLAGGAGVPDQGRFRFVDLYGPKPIERIITRNEIQWGMVTPGLSQRIPEFFVPFQFDRPSGKYLGQVHSLHAQALTKLNVARLGPPQVLPDVIAQWIPASGGNGTDASPYTSTLATAVAKRHTEHFGLGMILADFETTYSYYELQVGSLIAVPTDRFIGRDVQTSRQIRGLTWMIGVVLAIQNAKHTQFRLWVRSYADLIASTEAARRLGFSQPVVLNIEPTLSPASVASAVVTCEHARAVKLAVSTSAYPSKATVQAAGVQALTVEGTLSTGSLGTVGQAQTLFIRALAYEFADGTGSESTFMGEAKITGAGPATPLPKVLLKTTSTTVDATSALVDVTLQITDSPAGHSTTVTLAVWVNKTSVDNPDPTAAADGSASIVLDGSGVGIADATTSFGGAGNLLDAVRQAVGWRVAKTIYAQVTAADGRVGEKFPLWLGPRLGTGDSGITDIGKMKRGFALDDGEYNLRSTASDGLTAHSSVKESGGKNINRLLAKALAGDPDDLDGVGDGTTYKRITGVSGGLVQTASIAASAVTDAKLATDAVTTVKIAASAVTAAKQATLMKCLLDFALADAPSISDNTHQIIDWFREVYDPDALHDNSANRSRITIPTGQGGTGLWMIHASVSYPANATGIRIVQIWKNGAVVKANRRSSVSSGGVETVDCVYWENGPAQADYYQVSAFQNSGGALTLEAGYSNTFFQAIQLY